MTGTHTFTVSSTNSAGHPFSDWSTKWTERTITVGSAGTYTARYRAGYIIGIIIAIILSVLALEIANWATGLFGISNDIPKAVALIAVQ